jgi:hypothetical protein
MMPPGSHLLDCADFHWKGVQFRFWCIAIRVVCAARALLTRPRAAACFHFGTQPSSTQPWGVAHGMSIKAVVLRRY